MWFALVLLGALSAVIIWFVVWRFLAYRRGEGFVVEMREDYRGGVPDAVWTRMQRADSWMRNHPIVYALIGAVPTTVLVTLFFNIIVGLTVGVAAGVFDWTLGRKRRQRP